MSVDERCAIEWTIFASDLLVWIMLIPLYTRGLLVALRFNRAIDTLVEHRLDDTETTAYLSSLNDLGKLFIAPFGIRITVANIVQLFLVTPVSIISAQLIKEIMAW